MYEAEDLNDPLHSGRDHHDIKYDLWALYKINPNVSIRFSTRYRERMTYSQYKWVSSLKKKSTSNMVKIRMEFIV